MKNTHRRRCRCQNLSGQARVHNGNFGSRIAIANPLDGEGETTIKPVLQLLKKSKCKIPSNIEYEYKGAHTIAEVKKCYQYSKDPLA